MKFRTYALGGLFAIVAGLVALFAVPVSAQAGDSYPPAGPTASISDTTVAQGGTLSGSVSGFEPGEGTGSYNPTFAFTVGADGTGTFSHQVPVDQAPGDYVLTLTSGATSATTTFTVVAAQDGGGAGGGDLPRTGSDGSLPMAQTAIAAIAAGGLMVLVARRKKAAA